jgi:gliding motility-associated lipoprotein GldD
MGVSKGEVLSRRRSLLWVGAWCAMLLLHSCTAEPRPRPRTYPRLVLPERAYRQFTDPRCPCTFEYPSYGVVGKLKNDSCDFDIHFPPLGATWHVTNRRISAARRGPGSRSDLYEQYRRLLYHHTQKATEISERTLRVAAGGGTFFELKGQVPTSAQIFLSDSTRHALVVAFYFTTALKNDSLAPVITYSKHDLSHLAQTLRWH